MLRRCLPSKIQQSLHRLPETLDETYRRILEEIPETNRDYAQRLLQCLAEAIRPLRVEELAETLAFDWDATEGEAPTFNADWRPKDQERELLSACPSLITIVDDQYSSSRVVQFSHFSVKEFLISDRLATPRTNISYYHIRPEVAHTTLAQVSLGYLLSLDYLEGGWGSPLAEYAAEYWVSHAQVGSVSSRLKHAMKTLFDPDKTHFTAWIRVRDIDKSPGEDDYSSHRNPPTSKSLPLYYSALCGFYDIVEHLVKKHSHYVNAHGGEHNYPLVAALHGGHIRVAEYLCQHGANVDILESRRQQSPLHTAIAWPDHLVVSTVQFLLKHRADVNARRGDDLNTPLHLAAYYGHVEVAQMLLKSGAEVNSRNLDGRTPLHLVPAPSYARGEGNQRPSLISLLVEYGAEVDSRDANGATALHYISLMEDLEVAWVLLDHGADVNAKDNWHRTPLHQVSGTAWDSSDEDRFSVAQLFVECGADLNAQDKDHRTPLHSASYYPGPKLVQMLLDHGANVNAVDNSGRTPLHQAFCYDSAFREARYSVAKLLVVHGADVNARDKDHETPLHLSSYSSETEGVHILLDYGADINAKNIQGQTPLHRAFKFEPEMHIDHLNRYVPARLLVARGADVNARDEDLMMPFHLATRIPELDIMRMLLDHGMYVNAGDFHGRTVLHRVLAAKDYSDEYHFGVVQLLVERGAEVNTLDRYFDTPLHLASHIVSLEVALILLKRGAVINVKNLKGETPFQIVRERMTKEPTYLTTPAEIQAWRAQGVVLLGLLCGY